MLESSRSQCCWTFLATFLLILSVLILRQDWVVEQPRASALAENFYEQHSSKLAAERGHLVVAKDDGPSFLQTPFLQTSLLALEQNGADLSLPMPSKHEVRCELNPLLSLAMRRI